MKSKKTLTIILWLLFVACIFPTVYLNRAVANSDPDYEEVDVTVVSSETVTYVNRKTGSRTNKYEIEVRYKGETYDLKNAHNAYSYREGATVKAYLAKGKLYANVEGVKTSTPLAMVYYIFLFGTFGLFFGACMSMSKKKTKWKPVTDEKPQKEQAPPSYDPERKK